jgi:nicotinate-nucleotide--dimethylbenzimidazole phosphoribosyltransferase
VAARQAALDLFAATDGEFGRLSDVGVWLAGVRGTGSPPPFHRVRTVVVGSPDSAPRTPRQLRHGLDVQLADDAVEALSASLGTVVRRVDVATPGETDDVLRKESRDAYRHAVPELTLDEFDAAYELGRFVADEEADAGTDLLVVGIDAAGRDADLTATATLCAALLGREPVAMVGTDSGAGSATGMDDRTWTARVAATRDALRRLRATLALADPQAEPARRRTTSGFGGGVDADPAEVARLVGGPRIAVLIGLLRQSVSRRTPVLLDGAIPCAAALVAARLEPDAQDWWQAAGRPPEPAAQAAQAALGLVPVLDLGVRLGNGAGGLLAVPVLEAAADLLAVLTGAPHDQQRDQQREQADADRAPGR